MRKIYFVFLFSAIALMGRAQTEAAQDSVSFRAVVEACIGIRDAVAAGDTVALKASSQKLADEKPKPFNTLRPDSVEASVNGHVVFDSAFATQYAVRGDEALSCSADINRQSDIRRGQMANGCIIRRGQTANGSILTKTCFVKAGSRTSYRFNSRGTQRLAVVPEAGGRVTLRIHVTNAYGYDKRFDDTTDVKKGRSHRETTFTFPDSKSYKVELEVINCTNKDLSFVVISN